MLKAICRISVTSAFLFVSVLNVAHAQIAPGEQQSAAQTATITGTVMQSDGAPVSGAEVRLTGPAMLTTKSDAHGLFVFTSVPFGTYHIDVVAEGLGTASKLNVAVKGDTTVAIQYFSQSAGGLKEIARVSTNSAGASINVTPASIASITPSAYAFEGNTSWRQLLAQIPGVTVNGGLHGGTSTATTNFQSPNTGVIISVNGAPPYETSTTLDGMPLQNITFNGNPGYGADLSVLAMPMFDTADVVRGPGADAPSLVDSIGGSLVLHAPGHVDKNTFELSVSNDPFGGFVSDAKAALHVGKLSATIVYSLDNSPGPFGAQNVVAANSFRPITVNGQAFAGCGAPCFSVSPQGVFQDPLLYCCRLINTSWTQHSGAISLLYDIAPSVTAQVFYAGFSSRQYLVGGLNVTNFTPGAGYSGGLIPGTYTFLESFGNLPEASSSSVIEEKVTAYVGKGVLRVAALQNNSFAQEISSGILFPQNGIYTLYGTGYYASAPSTPVNFNGVSAFLTFPQIPRNYLTWTNNRDYLISYGTQIGVSSTAGFSYVVSSYNSPLIFGGFCSLPPSVSETTRELRLHASTQLSERFSLDASWYVARGSYHVQNPDDPSGNTFVDVVFPYSAPRFGATWQISPDITVRAAAGGGYALPGSGDINSSNNPPVNQGSYYDEQLTNLNLQPERAFGFDIGTDMRFHRSTVLSLDLYRTNLTGQFYQSATLDGTYLGLPLYVVQEKNLAQSRYEGINVSVYHDVPKGWYWQASLGIIRGYMASVPSGFYDAAGGTCDFSTGAGCTNTDIVPGINFDGYFQPSVPYANGSARIGYRWAPGKYIELSPTYYGNNNSYFQPAFLEFDARVGYPLTKNVSLLATFRNITGVYDQNFQTWGISAINAPSVVGPPNQLNSVPYGPRTVIVTLNFKN